MIVDDSIFYDPETGEYIGYEGDLWFSHFDSSKAIQGGFYFEDYISSYEGSGSPAYANTSVSWDLGEISGSASGSVEGFGGMYIWPFEGFASADASVSYNYRNQFFIAGNGTASVLFNAGAYSGNGSEYCEIRINQGDWGSCFYEFSVNLNEVFELELQTYNSANASAGSIESMYSWYDFSSAISNESVLTIIQASELPGNEVPEPSTFLLSLIPLAAIGYRKAFRK